MIRYGYRAEELSQAAAGLGQLLGTPFRPHESSFLGGDYYRAEVAEGEILLQQNLDILDDESFDRNWPTKWVILSFNGLDDSAWSFYTTKLKALEVSGEIQLLHKGS